MDYTTVAAVKTYGPIDTSNDDGLLGSLVTAVSAALDQYCNMAFSFATYTNQVQRATIDRDGLISFRLPVPTISALTALAWKLGTSLTWTAIDLTVVGAVEQILDENGSTVRVITPTFLQYRGSARMQVQLSYSGGWAALAAVPTDFELMARRLTWWTYKKREAPVDKTAMVDTGIVIIPSSWPPDIKQGLRNYVRSW